LIVHVAPLCTPSAGAALPLRSHEKLGAGSPDASHRKATVEPAGALPPGSRRKAVTAGGVLTRNVNSRDSMAAR
jgi:hypothetical protein